MQVSFHLRAVVCMVCLAIPASAKSLDETSRVSMSISSRSGFAHENGSTERASIMRFEAPSPPHPGAQPAARGKPPPGPADGAARRARRGALRPPMPPLAGAAAHGGASAESLARAEAEAYDARVYSDHRRKLSQQGRYKDTRRQERHAAESWRFRGPTPLPVLQDPRLTPEQKERELERLMEKLHVEFFLKRDMGHSRLRQARERFYEAVADYAVLTGRQRPSHFHFEELPVLEEGTATLQEDEADGEAGVGPGPNVVLVPDSKPDCLSGCQGGGPICNENASQWTATQACTCLRAWQACSLVPPCTQTMRDTDGFFIALNTRESEVCAWPQGKLYDHLHIAQLSHRPTNVSDPIDEGGESGNLLQRGAGPLLSPASAHPSARHWRGGYETEGRRLGVTLEPLLEAQERRAGLLEGEGARAGEWPAGKTNPPTGCRVSHAEMLGDGNCDGGTYNTAACNFDGGDCCDSDCRPAMHRCGVGGYQCSGARTGVRANSEFQCSRDKVGQFSEYFDTLRDKLTLGSSMLSTQQCGHLTQEEHNNVAQAFNLGVELGYYAQTRSAAAQTGGPEMYIDCGLWDKQMGNDWFGTLITHELGHSAGYGHPLFKEQTYYSECENIGSTYCHGHCMEWTMACQNHGIFGSEMCGFASFGCKTKCVHSDYCYSLPERLTECFGYQKVHSRSETLTERAAGVVEGIFGFNPLGWSPLGWLGIGGAQRPPLVLALALACCALQPLLA